MNPASIAITILLCLSILAVPRKYMLVPFIAAALMIPMDQRISIAGLDFTPLRLCVLTGYLRLSVRGESHSIGLNSIDKLMVAWMTSGALIYVLQWKSFDAVINRSGWMFDGLGLYFLFRLAFAKWDDIAIAIRSLAIFALLSAPLILLERIRQTSSYSIFGHAPTFFHAGRFRCAGAFPHSILMGIFWATVLPFFYACIKAGLSKLFYWLAILAALLCVVLSGSSTPLMTAVFLVPFILIYRYRIYGKHIAVGIFLLLLGLHLMMSKPVWHLMARFSFFSGSTGWHRYALFDQFVNRFFEWFMLGSKSTEHWGSGLFDLTNQYVLEGVRGGFLTLIFFVALNSMSIILPWKAAVQLKKPALSWLSWGICVSVIGHSVSFWGVSYFGQIIMLLYLTFAMVAFVQEQMNRSSRMINL